jgi:hypothetical protein
VIFAKQDQELTVRSAKQQFQKNRLFIVRSVVPFITENAGLRTITVAVYLAVPLKTKE